MLSTSTGPRPGVLHFSTGPRGHAQGGEPPSPATQHHLHYAHCSPGNARLPARPTPPSSFLSPSACRLAAAATARGGTGGAAARGWRGTRRRSRRCHSTSSARCCTSPSSLPSPRAVALRRPRGTLRRNLHALVPHRRPTRVPGAVGDGDCLQDREPQRNCTFKGIASL